jgi:anaerobic magnesium-protoporphyrin IX monomethyl ester cyclase
MPDILLIQPPIRDFYLTAKRTLPYGLASIAAALRQAGFSAAICDGLATAKSRSLPWPEDMGFLKPYYGRPDTAPFGLFHHFRHFGYSLDHIARAAGEAGAFLIGISSLFTAYSDMALATAEAVRKSCPKAYIVLGGHHPTALPEAVMANSAVDFVLRGDGEAGMPALARALRTGTPLDSVPGLVWRRSVDELVVHPPAVVEDLDRLPAPAFDLINWRHYQRAGRGSLSLSASRGCPLRCTYCAVNAASQHEFRRRSVSSVMAELQVAADCMPLGFIDFEDEHLTADRSWALALMDGIARRFGASKPELRAMNGLYAPALDEAVLARMQKAGFKTINLALITTSAAQLRRFGRLAMADDLDRVLALCGTLGLKCVAYLIVAGPDQDPYASVEDLIFLAQRRVLAGVSVFYPAPGSSDYRWCRKEGLLPASHGLMRATALPLAHHTDRRQAVTLLRLGRLLNFAKGLLDAGGTLPLPAAAPRRIDVGQERLAVGRQLLAAFLKSGAIVGVGPEGKTFPHEVDGSLTRRFRQELMEMRLQGSR